MNTTGFTQPKKKLIVLGFDGADAKMVERLMDAGRMPNLARLAQDGSYHRLTPTNPPQTPVSWSSMATGLNPGKTGIFDFLKRDKGSYYPTFALMEERYKPFLFGKKNGIYLGSGSAFLFLLLVLGVGRWKKWSLLGNLISGLILSALVGGGIGYIAGKWLPAQVPAPKNNRQGVPFWTIASQNGLRVRVLRYPTAFPVDKIKDGKMLSGLGVPDIRGTIGQPTIFTDDASLLARANEFSLRIMLVDTLHMDDFISVELPGPRNKILCDTRKPECREYLKEHNLPLQFSDKLYLKLDLQARNVRIRYREKEITLNEGEWSDWVVFTFRITPLLKIKAIGRFYLVSVDPFLKLYLSPLHFHPEMAKAIPFSWPPSFVKDLADRVGFFKTMGWAIDTWTITSGLVDEHHFITDMNMTVEQYRKVMEEAMRKSDWDLFVMVYSFTDRVQHILWRLIDPQHPLYDPKKAQQYGMYIEKAYEMMDEIVGEALKVRDENTDIIVVSDHGFSSFRRGINYNTWLVEHGFMKIKGEFGEVKTLEDLFGGGDFFEHVDWSQTKAYAIGLGPIYINLKGREPHGIVEPGEEYEAVRKAIIEGLESYIDPVTGEKPVYKVYTREEMYGSGFDSNLIPDLRVANIMNYRVSWQTTLGNVGSEVAEDNLKNWSADHCSLEPTFVKGIFFASWKIHEENPTITDIMPTLLDRIGVPIPEGIDGKVIQ